MFARPIKHGVTASRPNTKSSAWNVTVASTLRQGGILAQLRPSRPLLAKAPAHSAPFLRRGARPSRPLLAKGRPFGYLRVGFCADMRTTRRANWWSLVRDRAQKKGLYDSAHYWDSKAESFQGLARSNWPSNSYNACMHAAQMREVDRIFGDVRGLSIADIGCGTGRASMHLAKRGAKVTGFDFSASAIAAADREARGQGLTIDFAQRDVFGSVPAELQGKFDGALTIGCLAIACDTPDRLVQAIDHVAKLVKRGERCSSWSRSTGHACSVASCR